MRCGCKNCGEYMVQREKGLFSGCVCENCGYECTACMGNRDAPLSPGEIRNRFEVFDGETSVGARKNNFAEELRNS